MNFRSRSIAPPTSSLCAMSPSARDRSTMSCTSRSIRARARLAEQLDLLCRQVPLRDDPGPHRVVDVVVDVRDPVHDPHHPPLQRRRLLRPRVIEDPVPDLLGQVEPPAVTRQHLDDPERVLVVPEPHPVLPQRLIEHLLADVPEGRMPEVVPSPIASVRSSFSPSARATVREMKQASSVCVSRVR